jgi:hypothetical protein
MKVHYRVHKSPRQWSLSWTRWIQSTPPPHFNSPRRILILSSHLCRDLSIVPFLSGIRTKSSHISHGCNMPCSSYPSWLDEPNEMWWRERKIKLLIKELIQLSLSSCLFFSLRSEFYYSLQPILKRPQSIYTFSLGWKNNLHTIHITDKITVLYSSVFRFLNTRRVGKRLWKMFNLLLISRWMQFWFVVVVPKHLNFTSFSNDLLAVTKLRSKLRKTNK